ncbi:hypothetical protein ACGC1H_005815 [Rhizoctonia solani]
MISRTMTMSGIRPHLARRGILDLTDVIHWSSMNPIAGGGFADIYDAIINPLPVRPSSRSPPSSHGSAVNVDRYLDMGFSDVRNSRPSHPSGMRVAIKIRRSVPNSLDYDQQIASHIYKWSKCEHRNVLKLLGFAMFHGRIGLVLPWAGKGTVMDYFRDHPSVGLRERFDKCAEICRGVEYLHSIGIVHGDIKGVR